MKTDLILNSLYQLAQSLRHSCGTARIYEMSALVTHLLELQHTLTTTDDAEPGATGSGSSPEDLRQLGADVEEVVHFATLDHAFLVCNRRSDPPSEVSLISSTLYDSDLEYGDKSSSETEYAQYEQLCQTLPAMPPLQDRRTPYPLCELAVQLSVAIRSQANLLAQRLQAQLNYAQRQHHTDQHDSGLQHYIDRTIQAGLMTDSGQWQSFVSRSQIAYWVDIIARRLNIDAQWKWASHRWGLPSLASYQNRILMGGNVPARQVIDKIFE